MDADGDGTVSFKENEVYSEAIIRRQAARTQKYQHMMEGKAKMANLGVKTEL